MVAQAKMNLNELNYHLNIAESGITGLKVFPDDSDSLQIKIDDVKVGF